MAIDYNITVSEIITVKDILVYFSKTILKKVRHFFSSIAFYMRKTQTEIMASGNRAPPNNKKGDTN